MITTTLRIDEELYNEIAKIASEEKRSINSQILYVLAEFITKHNEKSSIKN